MIQKEIYLREKKKEKNFALSIRTIWTCQNWTYTFLVSKVSKYQWSLRTL